MIAQKEGGKMSTECFNCKKESGSYMMNSGEPICDQCASDSKFETCTGCGLVFRFPADFTGSKCRECSD